MVSPNEIKILLPDDFDAFMRFASQEIPGADIANAITDPERRAFITGVLVAWTNMSGFPELASDIELLNVQTKES